MEGSEAEDKDGMKDAEYERERRSEIEGIDMKIRTFESDINDHEREIAKLRGRIEYLKEKKEALEEVPERETDARIPEGSG